MVTLWYLEAGQRSIPKATAQYKQQAAEFRAFWRSTLFSVINPHKLPLQNVNRYGRGTTVTEVFSAGARALATTTGFVNTAKK